MLPELAATNVYGSKSANTFQRRFRPGNENISSGLGTQGILLKIYESLKDEEFLKKGSSSLILHPFLSA